MVARIVVLAIPSQVPDQGIVRSQDATERSWFKVSRFCCTSMKYSCDRVPELGRCGHWLLTDDRDRSVSRGDNRPYDRGLPWAFLVVHTRSVLGDSCWAEIKTIVLILSRNIARNINTCLNSHLSFRTDGVRTSQQCVCIYTAVYSQTLEAVISQRTCAQGWYYLIISSLWTRCSN